jgi:hypothetical protein
LAEQKAVPVKTRSFQCHRVPDAKAAPTHQQGQGAMPGAVGVSVSPRLSR